ncbi:MAG: hypothetical protein JRI96_14905 [Deltaproteobacteria bacterium]|nr:hypothetical protein [Deltaproteobacteria bacterium]
MMENKEKAECLIELCKIQMDHFRQTRDIEFKVNLALWTLVALGGKFFYDKIKLDTCCEWVIYIVFALAIIFTHFFFWMRPIQDSEDRDIRFIYQCREKLIEGESSDWRGGKWTYFEVAITFALLVGVGIVLVL